MKNNRTTHTFNQNHVLRILQVNSLVNWLNKYSEIDKISVESFYCYFRIESGFGKNNSRKIPSLVST